MSFSVKVRTKVSGSRISADPDNVEAEYAVIVDLHDVPPLPF